MSHEMEIEDFVRQKDAELASLREELQRLRLHNEALDRECQLLLGAARKATKENLDMRRQLQAWADDADEQIRRARRAELEACEE